MSEIKKNDL